MFLFAPGVAVRRHWLGLKLINCCDNKKATDRPGSEGMTDGGRCRVCVVVMSVRKETLLRNRREIYPWKTGLKKVAPHVTNKQLTPIEVDSKRSRLKVETTFRFDRPDQLPSRPCDDFLTCSSSSYLVQWCGGIFLNLQAQFFRPLFCHYWLAGFVPPTCAGTHSFKPQSWHGRRSFRCYLLINSLIKQTFPVTAHAESFLITHFELGISRA